MKDEFEFIERKIIIGMITSSDFLQKVYPIWTPDLLSSAAAGEIAEWCIGHYKQFGKAPSSDLESIYSQKLREGIHKDRAEAIESILEDLSKESVAEPSNIDFLLDQSFKYFQSQHLKTHSKLIKDELVSGSITEAEKIASSYAPIKMESPTTIDPFSSASRIEKAFNIKKESLIKYPKALGDFWNDKMVRGAFIGFMGQEKIGKTFTLIELAMRGLITGFRVSFFGAGDMTEDELIVRLCIYLAKRSNDERYCGGMFVPTIDCIHNQTDVCTRSERECDFGIFGRNKNLNDIKYDELVQAYQDNPEYQPCRNCNKQKAIVWIKWRDPVNPLTAKEAIAIAKSFYQKHKRQFKLSCYPNETLTTKEMDSQLDIWDRQENFVPDITILDYADLLAPDLDVRKLEFRHQQNRTWQRLRRLSQQRHCLLITATLADAKSYDQHLLKLSNFSEDKRKYAHVTAMYGMNQDPEEKRLGIMRFNELVVREGDFDRTNQIRVLQRLQMGRPFLGSYR
jgi:hypothetical protein